MSEGYGVRTTRRIRFTSVELRSAMNARQTNAIAERTYDYTVYICIIIIVQDLLCSHTSICAFCAAAAAEFAYHTPCGSPNGIKNTNGVRMLRETCQRRDATHSKCVRGTSAHVCVCVRFSPGLEKFLLSKYTCMNEMLVVLHVLLFCLCVFGVFGTCST